MSRSFSLVQPSDRAKVAKIRFASHIGVTDCYEGNDSDFDDARFTARLRPLAERAATADGGA